MAATLGVKQPFRLELSIGDGSQDVMSLWFPEWVDFYNVEGHRDRHWVYQNQWSSEGQTLRSQQCLGQVAQMQRTVTQHADLVELEIMLQNIGDSPLSRIDQTTCLSLATAPQYRDPTGDRTYLVMDGQLTATSALAVDYDHAPGIAGAGMIGEPLPMKDGSKRCVTDGVYFVVAQDKQSVLGHTWEPARRFSYDRRGVVACIHIQPMFDDVGPGEECFAKSTVFVTENTLEDTYERYKAC